MRPPRKLKQLPGVSSRKLSASVTPSGRVEERHHVPDVAGAAGPTNTDITGHTRQEGQQDGGAEEVPKRKRCEWQLQSGLSGLSGLASLPGSVQEERSIESPSRRFQRAVRQVVQGPRCFQMREFPTQAVRCLRRLGFFAPTFYAAAGNRRGTSSGKAAAGDQHWHRSAAASSCSLKLLSLEAMCYWYEPCNLFSPSAGWKGPSSLLRDRRGRCCGGQERPTSGCSSIPHPEGKDARSGDIEGEQRRFRPSGGPECRRQLGIPHSERRPDARYQSKGWPCKAKGGEGFSWSRRRSWRCFECTPQRLALALCEQSGVSGVDAELLGQLESERKCRAETARVCYS